MTVLLELEPSDPAHLTCDFSCRVLKTSVVNASVRRIGTSAGTFTTRMCHRRTGKVLPRLALEVVGADWALWTPRG